jgi:hypothetical protein
LEPKEELDGEIGAAVALGAKVGMAISAASAKATIRAFMTESPGLPIVVIFATRCSAGASQTRQY